MSLSPLRCAILFGLQLGGTLSAAHAHAQQHLQIGNFRVMIYTSPATGRDLSFARVKPEGRVNGGDLVWACGGDPAGLSVGIQLGTTPTRVGAARQALFRFDLDEHYAGAFLGKAQDLWVLRDQDTAPATARALTAERLVVWVEGDGSSQPPERYAYRLTGLDSVLGRLGCSVRAGEDGERAGIVTLRTLAAGKQGPDSAAATELIVEEVPRLVSRTEVLRQVSRNYPPLLRDRRVSGTVVLRFRVRETGVVDTASIAVDRSTHPSTHRDFVAAAIRVVTVVRWHPARLDGRPVGVWVTMPVYFILAPLPAASQPPLR